MIDQTLVCWISFVVYANFVDVVLTPSSNFLLQYLACILPCLPYSRTAWGCAGMRYSIIHSHLLNHSIDWRLILVRSSTGWGFWLGIGQVLKTAMTFLLILACQKLSLCSLLSNIHCSSVTNIFLSLILWKQLSRSWSICMSQYLEIWGVTAIV